MSPFMMLGKMKGVGMNLRWVIGRIRDIMWTLILRQKRLAQIDKSDMIVAFVLRSARKVDERGHRQGRHTIVPN